MIIGDPSTFAIESGITQAYARLSFRALGFFVIHIGGRSFGVRKSDATMLACSLDEVAARLARRGSHTASFVIESGGDIADAVRDAIYAPEEEGKKLFGLSQSELGACVYAQHLLWAPDGDEAFDDSSYILQFDAGPRVRLIGFRSHARDNHHDPTTLADVWLDAATFYQILDQWRIAFLAEWQTAQKISEEEDQKEPNQAAQTTPGLRPSVSDL